VLAGALGGFAERTKARGARLFLQLPFPLAAARPGAGQDPRNPSRVDDLQQAGAPPLLMLVSTFSEVVGGAHVVGGMLIALAEMQ
jgi:hypothetical protein